MQTTNQRVGSALGRFSGFVTGSLAVITRGSFYYFGWVTFLLLLITMGAAAYATQTDLGLVVTNMRDQVSWGFYIGNFAFLVGVAAAAVVLVIPAYVYDWRPIKEVVLVGEIMAISAVIMCILFVTVDVGRPERLWHLVPVLGNPNFPFSLLIWDILVLNLYFLINFYIVTYLVYKAYRQKKYNANFIMPLIFLSIPLAICIHTVTAFLFMSLVARPFWHTAILAPRFIASAFCSGPSLLVLIFMFLRRVGRMEISDVALLKIGELLAFAMGVNLFFLGSEIFTEFYFQTTHAVHGQFQWFGIHGRTDIALYTWFALGCNSIAFLMFSVPLLRSHVGVLGIGCALAASGVFIEKSLGLLLPGMTPDVLGEVYAYNPNLTEIAIGVGIWAVGALCFTLMVKVATSIGLGRFRDRTTLLEHEWQPTAPPRLGDRTVLRASVRGENIPTASGGLLTD
jgi:molybdopterin-containing oxidoreductase family membrane subunit